MTRINLLPWRNSKSRQREKEFYLSVGVAGVAALGLVALLHLGLTGRIDTQQARLRLLESELQNSAQLLEKIKSLDAQKDSLTARMKIIDDLQKSRSDTAHLLDELAKAIPDGVQLVRVQRTSQTIKLEGIAQSNTSISAFMRNLQSSPWLDAPVLDIVDGANKEHPNSNWFTLQVSQADPSLIVPENQQ